MKTVFFLSYPQEVSMSLCQYRNALGVPGEGIHSIRIFGFAAVDIGLTLLAAVALSRHSKLSLTATIPSLFLFAVGVHYLFCVKTALNVLIFGKVEQ